MPLEKKPEQDAPPALRDKKGYLQILISLLPIASDGLEARPPLFFLLSSSPIPVFRSLAG